MAKSKTGIEHFEKDLEKLEDIIQKLEAGKLSLQEGLSFFEQGVELYKSCKNVLGQAEKKVKLLSSNLKEEDF